MIDYTWTDDLSKLNWSQIDAIEVAGCVDLGDAVERVEDDSIADMFSVYVHRPGEGAECIADRNTAAEAEDLAVSLAAPRGLPIYRY